MSDTTHPHVAPVPAWRGYQEEAAAFFRSIGLRSSTDVSIQGVRTRHDVDVVVEIDVAGFSARWLVECKHWKTAVTKLHVLALREIVSDTGSDRGIILCESGFQSGAAEAASLTNVQITSLAALSSSSADAVFAVRLRELYDRNEACRLRYWDMPKDVRIARGLRFDVGDSGMYSGAHVIDVASEVIAGALRGRYPLNVESMYHYAIDRTFPLIFKNATEVVSALAPLIAELESKLDGADSPPNSL